MRLKRANILVFLMLALAFQSDALAGSPVGDVQRARAGDELKRALREQVGFIKVHAAEALLELEMARTDVRQVFEEELRLHESESPYRIGIWRVLARAADTPGGRQVYIDKVLAAYNDPKSPDSLHAVETLAKLGYPLADADRPALLKWCEAPQTERQAYAQCWLAAAGTPDDVQRLADLLTDPRPITRGVAAYGLRHLTKPLPPAVLDKLAAAADAAQPDESRAYVIGAGFVTTPDDARRQRYRIQLLALLRDGATADKTEVLNCFAARGNAYDVPLIEKELDNPEADVRICAARALLNIDRRLKTHEPQLRDQLAELRNKLGVETDEWADAQIFLKGVIWANDFGPADDPDLHRLVEMGERRARERADALAAGHAPWAQRRGRVARGFVSAVDGSTQPYGVVIPASYDPAKPIRLDVVLHGSSGDRAKGIAELRFLSSFDTGDTGGNDKAPDVDYIELHPLGRLGENAYRFEGETDVDEAIQSVCRNYNIDRARIVLRGSSLGGVGTWQLGLKRPDRYVAIGPTAGPVDTYVFASAPWKHFVRLAPLTPWQKVMLHEVDAIDYAANAGMVPVVALMGDQDPYFPSHLLMQKAFEKEGIPFVGLIDPGAGHGPTQKAYAEQLRLIDEHVAKGKDPAPPHVRFVTWTLKFSRCNWAEVLGLGQHYHRAEIDGHLAADGSVTMTEPLNITRFALDAPALQTAGSTLTIGGKNVSIPAPKDGAPRTVVIERKSDTWQYLGDRTQVSLTGKRPGLQGPIDDAFATPFLCVRGTGKPWNPAAAAWADASLRRFADEWRRHYRADLPIKNEADVTDDDVRRCNLILFGDPGSNHWIADILPKLPIQWTRESIQVGSQHVPAANHGLAMIYPNPLPAGQGHYVVFNSGHTYHEDELRFSYMVFPRLGDWAILKAGENPPGTSRVAETVIDSGFFDEAWDRVVAAQE